MADGSVRETVREGLTFDQTSRVETCAYQAVAILRVIRHGAEVPDVLPDGALAGACWAVEDLVSEMERIATGGNSHG